MLWQTKGLMTMKTKICSLVLAITTITAATLSAQTFTTLHHFAGYPTDGSDPYAALILSGDTLYGTTVNGGTNYYYDGTVFSIKTNGTGFTTLYNFTGAGDGCWPYAELILSGTNLYGTTSANAGGASAGATTVFSINTNGTGFTVPYNFGFEVDGPQTIAGLIISGGTLFGTTFSGGPLAAGMVFAVDTTGAGFSVLHGFDASDGPGFTTPDSAGVNPYSRLVLSGTNLYGTTLDGGSSMWGTVYAVNTSGTVFTNLHNFTADVLGGRLGDFVTNSDGANPCAGLVLSGNTLYGTAYDGGSSGYGTVFAMDKDGANFRVLQNFTGGSDGANPFAGLILSGSTLYGTTVGGGTNGYGTVFAVNTNGTGFTTLYTFANGSDGAAPYAGLILSGSTLYGTTSTGGTNGCGTVFALRLSGP